MTSSKKHNSLDDELVAIAIQREKRSSRKDYIPIEKFLVDIEKARGDLRKNRKRSTKRCSSFMK